jgi:hypothetical protein
MRGRYVQFAEVAFIGWKRDARGEISANKHDLKTGVSLRGYRLQASLQQLTINIAVPTNGVILDRNDKNEHVAFSLKIFSSQNRACLFEESKNHTRLPFFLSNGWE